ncbi:NADPH-dependent F420 reductase [Nocardia brasiliensis]|uniref:NADPH-dependent F420 reductase n=1 Tax=Nocardia brasiliensis TaxID=37326 RepID=UPI002453D1CE|nr:NAD(P)-binding domain-containing protein [Nocardia brasiliensis]
MTTLGLIGSGNIGGTVARLAIAAGLDVVLSNSRGPETLNDLVAELGPRARAATPDEAAAAGEIVVVTVPQRKYQQVPVAPLAGKVVIDTNNYYPDRDGTFAELADGTVTSSELLQKHLPTSKVVKAFNNIYFVHLGELARPAGAVDRSALPIAGNDTGAKAAAAQLIDALGYDTVDVGPLSESWRFQVNTPVYADAYAAALPFWENAATPADGTRIRELLAAAQR